MKYWIVEDGNMGCRDAVVAADDELDEMFDNYSGYYVLNNRCFDTLEEATEWCDAYNMYEGAPDEQVHCDGCCCGGCTMTAFQYAHWNGNCSYK